MSINSSKNNKGFTLVEIMVATSIFVLVVMIALGAIFTVVDANKKAQSLKSVMNNLNFALETMTRTIKTGQIKSVLDTSIDVVDQNGDEILYSFSGSKITVTNITQHTSAMDITAPEVVMKKMQFIGKNIPGSGQPMVIMILQGEAKLSERIWSDFNIQTTVTQRLLNK